MQCPWNSQESERRYFTATMHDFMSPASMATHNTKTAWSRRHLIHLVELVNKIGKVQKNCSRGK